MKTTIANRDSKSKRASTMSQKSKTTRTLIADLAETVVGLSEEELQGVSGGTFGGTGISATTLNCGRGQIGTVTHTYPGSLTLPAGESDKDSDEDCV